VFDSVRGSTTINVSGTTLANTAAYGSADIMLKVIAPNGNIVAIDQITPADGSFSTTISVGGNQFSQDGIYTIVATQSYGSHGELTDGIFQVITASTEVDILDGHVIPEFGTIAAMILVVSIVAIIVVSAKTKLSLVPRY
jgi:predicted secreted protein with PEFG-CTERM motif